MKYFVPVIVFGTVLALPLSAQKQPSFEIAGVSVTPHVRASSLRFNTPPLKAEGALLRLFVRNAQKAGNLQASEVLFNGRYPLRHILEGSFSWHDTPNVWHERDTVLPPGAVTVWTINTMKPQKAGRKMQIGIEDWSRNKKEAFEVSLEKPTVWLSAVTFLGSGTGVAPDRLVAHVVNNSPNPITLAGTRLYLPKDRTLYRTFFPQPRLQSLQKFPQNGVVPAGDRGVLVAQTGVLPLTYGVVEVQCLDSTGTPFSLWAKLRIKREMFDIGGGWIHDTAKDGLSTLLHEPYLKTLQRMHVNLGHHGHIPGYTDNLAQGSLIARYPMKLFDALMPIEQYDKDELLPYIHGVDALGEPQLAFSKDQHTPQEVWKALDRYGASRLPTTITLNDESTWLYYAGLSDYPHHDNYRVTAPSTDNFRLYERFGKPIGWGSPLETIGDLCRTLRDISRPAPTAYWSQGAHNGWDIYAGRIRTSPTPDELRLQAYHALAARITSLYWFNLSLKSLVKFPDTINEMTHVGREIRLLEAFYLEGDATHYRQTRKQGKLDWDLSVLSAPQGALLFALDLDYAPDPKKKIFVFGEPRRVKFDFPLPSYLRHSSDVFRIDANGITAVKYRTTERGVEIEDTLSRTGIYVATRTQNLRQSLEQRRQALVAQEQALGFAPANNAKDLELLRSLRNPRD